MAESDPLEDLKRLYILAARRLNRMSQGKIAALPSDLAWAKKRYIITGLNALTGLVRHEVSTGVVVYTLCCFEGASPASPISGKLVFAEPLASSINELSPGHLDIHIATLTPGIMFPFTDLTMCLEIVVEQQLQPTFMVAVLWALLNPIQAASPAKPIFRS